MLLKVFRRSAVRSKETHNGTVVPLCDVVCYIYGPRCWSVTEASRQRLDAFDQWCLRRILRVPYTAHITNVLVRSQTDQPPVSSLIQQLPPQAVWAYSLGCSLRRPLACATSIHWSPPCWLASPKRPTSSVLASNNRQWSQTTQPWTSLCITTSNGSSFLMAHRGNGYALRACHQMMMMRCWCYTAVYARRVTEWHNSSFGLCNDYDLAWWLMMS